MLRIVGKIYTGLMNPATTDAVLVGDDGKIVAVGEAAKNFPSAKVEEIALGSRVACPGFVDAHVHLDNLARELTELDLTGARSLDDVLSRVADAAKKLPRGRVLFGSGWDESTWPAHELPTREKLDRVAPARAIILRRVCGHLWAVNSETLKRIAAQKDVSPAQRARLAAVGDGLLRGDDLALAEPLAELSPDERRDGLLKAMRRALALGVTCVHDMRETGAARLDLARDAGTIIRIVAPGAKLVLDGSLGARTAALSFDYADAPGGRGTLYYETRALVERLRPHHDAGRAIALHAIGDRAIAQALDAFERLAEKGDSPLNSAKGTVPIFRGVRRIEHAEVLSEALIARMARFGVIASMQPNFVGRWQMPGLPRRSRAAAKPGGLYQQRLGARALTLNPFRSVLRAGVALAFGSDCMPMDPLFGIRSAMNHPLESERLTFVEALHAYTLAAAKAGGLDALTGSIEPGKEADLAILTGDPAMREDATVEQTLVSGRLAP